VLRDLTAPARPLEAVEREPLLPDFLAAPLDLRAPPGFAADERLDAEPDDLARLVLAFLAPPLDRAFVPELFAPPDRAFVPLDFDALGRDLVPLVFDALDRDPPDELRALPDRAPLLRDEPELPPPLALSPADHLPDITRCAASATASAMIEPSLVALDTMLLAARSAVSAASSPASRIFLRAAGLALIAAAAAASPAASISLLIAALANLSILSLFEPERDELDPERDDEERDELLREDFAIFYLPRSPTRHLNAVPVPE
jgi:hypothetical protein